jgi:hypothetical protein
VTASPDQPAVTVDLQRKLLVDNPTWLYWPELL